jgi:hypothetical protein
MPVDEIEQRVAGFKTMRFAVDERGEGGEILDHGWGLKADLKRENRSVKMRNNNGSGKIMHG